MAGSCSDFIDVKIWRISNYLRLSLEAEYAQLHRPARACARGGRFEPFDATPRLMGTQVTSHPRCGIGTRVAAIHLSGRGASCVYKADIGSTTTRSHL